MHSLDLVVLAGGKGTRIKSLLKKKPKPMANFNNKPFLEYVLQTYSKYNFKKIFLITGFKSEKIFKKFHNKFYNCVQIKCIRENKLMGTAGALYILKKKKINDFVLINGDTYTEININKLIKSCAKKSLCSLTLVKNISYKSNKKLSKIGVKNKRVLYENNNNYMNGGVYFFRKKILKLIQNKHYSLEDNVLPNLIKKRKVSGIISKNFFLDIGTPKNFKKAQNLLLKNCKKPAAFLDRDGVINYDYGYVHKINDFKLRTGVLAGLKFLIKNNYYIFIITNQAGIGKGIFSINEFYHLQNILKNKLQKKDIFFNDINFCPFHPKAKIKKYRRNSALRKPGNLMIKQIKKKWHIKENKSFMIGDKITDKICSNRSGLYFEYAKKNFYYQVRNIVKKFNNY